MSVKMDMKALERVTAQLKAVGVDDDNPYAVAAQMSCTDATYERMMCGPAQMTEAQCCVAAWCRLFRCPTRRVEAADVAFAMSAFSIPEVDATLYALDAFLPPADACKDVYQVLRACIGLSDWRSPVTDLDAAAALGRCADLLACNVEASRE